MSDSANLSLEFNEDEAKILSELDSLDFGFINLESSETPLILATISKAVKYFDNIIAQTVKKIEIDRETKLERIILENSRSNRSVTPQSIRFKLYLKACEELRRSVDCRIYLILGHFQLLIHSYDNALSAYLKYSSLEPEKSWNDLSFLYGLSLCYFHFNAFNKSIDIFQRILYINPSFHRSKEIHIRLGYIFKLKKNLEISLKYFKLALSNQTPATFSDIEINFHIGHLFEHCGKLKQADFVYDKILQCEKIPNHIRHLCLRQKAWIIYSTTLKRDHNNTTDVQLLQKALEINNSDGRTWYLLGRCQASLNRVQEAFSAYRSSIDKMEASADTWCSIGVLYQEQNQPMDALQAYFCAVQLDKCHSTAWANLGTLYESKQQYKEALKCYRNSINGENSLEFKNQIKTRIPIIETVIAKLGDSVDRNPISDPNKPNQHIVKLPTVDEAWSLPIPSELTQRQLQLMLAEVQGSASSAYNAAQNLKRKFVAGLLLNNESNSEKIKKTKEIPSDFCADPAKQRIKIEDDSSEPILDSDKKIKQEKPDEDEDASKSEFLKPSLPLTQQQKEKLIQLISRGSNLTNSERMEKVKFQSTLLRCHFGISSSSINQSTETFPSIIKDSSQVDNKPNHSDPKQKLEKIDHENLEDITAIAENQGNPDLPVDDLDFITEDLIAQLNTGDGTTNLDLDMALFSPDNATLNESLIKTETNETKEANRPGLVDDLKLCLTNALIQREVPKIPKTIDISMPSSVVVNMIRGLEVSLGEWWPALNEKWSRIPIPPPDVVLPVEFIKEPNQDKSIYLHPPTPTVYLENRKDSMSNELFQYCMSQPAVVIRGLASVLRMDLSLFSTKSLVESNPEHTVEIRTQRVFSPDENRDQQGKKTWYFNSPRTFSTISKYASYQASTFVTALKDEKTNTSSNNNNNSNTSNSSQNQSPNGKLTDPGDTLKPKLIKFGTNCDLSDEKKWLPQLHELNKLPAFLRVVSGCNMLSHVGYNLLGMNTVQLYMKVPGARTPGHQENNNMCAVNLNIGPGDCEWFIVPEQHWGTIYRLCEKNNIDYLSGSWWPIFDELEEASVPVYRFIQRPGDLVWLSPGSIHWVQSLGWCNNIAWNVAPISARQYETAFERYEFNRLKSFKSIVPMLHLTVQLSKNFKITDPHLYELMKLTLLRCLVQSQVARDFIENILKLPIKYHGKKPEDVAHTCYECECEVFNLLYVSQQDKQFVVRCLNCSRKIDPNLASFTVLCEYHPDQLAKIYDSFKLQNKPMTAYAVNKT